MMETGDQREEQVNGTTHPVGPTFVVNGRYKAVVTDRGHDGVISTVEHLIARERARLAGTPGSP